MIGLILYWGLLVTMLNYEITILQYFGVPIGEGSLVCMEVINATIIFLTIQWDDIKCAFMPERNTPKN